ncbi:hypothetical protein KCP77_15115 [Salmonella enterica subsp. enterica]|nr:hypothetical protein KCP77_15115 [Salmonella enterica subsp. enterica]
MIRILPLLGAISRLIIFNVVVCRNRRGTGVRRTFSPSGTLFRLTLSTAFSG